MYCLNHPYSKSHTTAQCKQGQQRKSKKPPDSRSQAEDDAMPPLQSRPFARLLATVAPVIVSRVLINGDDPDSPLPRRRPEMRELLDDFKSDIQFLVDFLPARQSFFDDIVVLLEANMGEHWHLVPDHIAIAKGNYTSTLAQVMTWCCKFLTRLKSMTNIAIGWLDRPGMESVQCYQMLNVFLSDTRILYREYDEAVRHHAEQFSADEMWHGLLGNEEWRAVELREYLAYLHLVRPMTPDHWIGNLIAPELVELPQVGTNLDLVKGRVREMSV